MPVALFVKHPIGVDTELIRELLSACGSLYAWKPSLDPSTGKCKNFGFAEYHEMSGLARALRLLSSVHLPDATTGERKPLLVKVDKGTTALLDIFNRSNAVNLPEDDAVRHHISTILRDRLGEVIMDSASAFLENILPSSANSNSALNSASVDGGGHGNFVREHRHRDDAADHVESVNEIDDKEEAQRRLERKKADIDRLFREKLQKWESREAYRARLRREHAAKDLDFVDRSARLREVGLQYYAEYDDDVERKLGKDEWFLDRDRWISVRKDLRDKERIFDDRDRQKELDLAARSEATGKNYERKLHTQQPQQSNGGRTISVVQFKDDLRRLLRNSLPFLNPLNEQPVSSEQVLKHSIDWNLLSEVAIKTKVVPLVEARITQFLGETEPDLVEFIVESILPVKKTEGFLEVQQELGKDPQDIIEEIGPAFGDSEEEKTEVQQLILMVWKCVIWEVEKKKLLGDRMLVGLDDGCSLESIEIAEVSV